MIVPGTIIPIRVALWYSIARLSRSHHDRFYPGKEIGGGDAKGRCNVDKLNDINPSLAVLILGDERLRLVQRFRQLGLCKSLGLARFDEKSLQQYLSGRAQGFLHSGRLSVEKGEPFR
ncbi:hypothetical protein QOZ94_004076 [Xanthobacter agilis]|jgi:hypothetical protein|uniref:Dinitrogenase iron-molybdenum cofactor biosynthesis domain-containing protein n=1 Tax=Xanthobacter agilis TaxID=47492 RepID=A0ABU0LJG3_XANAG|nr:hypothetical protein [Xanthobacter agilis]